MKNTLELTLFLLHVNNVLLKKEPNTFNFYGYQCCNDQGKWEIGVFKTFNEMYEFFYDNGFRKTKTLTKSIIMEKLEK